MKGIWQKIRIAMPIFSRRGQLVLLLSSLTQVGLSAIDGVALLLLTRVFQFDSTLESSGLLLQTSSGMLIAIIALFSLRSILASIVNWVTVKQLAREESNIAIKAFGALLNPKALLSGTTETHFHNQVDRAPASLLIVAINFAAICSEIVTVAVLLGVYFFFDSLTAFIAIVYFLLVVLVQHHVLSRLTKRQGERVVELRNSIYRTLADSAQLRKILTVTSASSLTRSLALSRSALSEVRGLVTILSTAPRYLLELTLALGLLTIGGAAFLASGPTNALNSVILFAGVSFRLLPTINRVQVLALSIVGEWPTAQMAFQTRNQQRAIESTTSLNSQIVLELDQVCFAYPQSSSPTLVGISLEIEFGKQYAVVGPSGAGKTTLADIFLGLLTPTEGRIVKTRDLRCAYVPQEPHIAFTSLAENVALVWDQSEVDPDRVKDALIRSGLGDLAARINDDSPLLNTALSGGQRQRIGLARAFYSDASFLVLDEVTSALDAVAERDVVNQIYELRGFVTTVVIAHRLSTVQRADHVFYLEGGQLIGSGSFQTLADSLPRFREQIELGKIQLDFGTS
jgi:ABC-type multidrug transport system fused ATPase/permease subunit